MAIDIEDEYEFDENDQFGDLTAEEKVTVRYLKRYVERRVGRSHARLEARIEKLEAAE